VDETDLRESSPTRR